jgi:Secretion system C-terminal sorting domain
LLSQSLFSVTIFVSFIFHFSHFHFSMKQVFVLSLLFCSFMATAQTYYLRGSEATCPWSGNFTSQCQLTDADADGVYELVLPLSAAAGAQEFKVYNQTADAWAPGGANAWYEHTGGSLTFKFRTADMSVEVADGPQSMCAPGEFTGWDNAAPMVNVSGNIWCYTIATPGTYIWKPTECGSWRSFLPTNGERSMDSPNWSVTTSVANEKVCVEYNPLTGRALLADAPAPPTCANPVPAASGITASSANLTWPAVSGATSYLVSYRPNGTTMFTNVTVTSNAATLSNLYFNTKYQYKVKSNCATLSPALKTFTTLNTPSCKTPYFMPHVVTGTSIAVKWRAVSGETAQQLQYRKVGVTAWTSVSVPVADSSKVLTGLLPNSSYQYRLRVSCSGAYLPYTGIVSATTLIALTESDPQNLVVTNDTNLGVFPNPTASTINVSFNADQAQLRLVDMTGRQLLNWDQVANGQQIDISSLPAGVYYLQAVLPNEETLTQRVVKQ